MIYGTGLDLQSVTQMKDMIFRQPPSALARIFTPGEMAYCARSRTPEHHYAARWAVKEAFFKALGTGLSGGYRLTDVETVNLDKGRPHVILHGKALEESKRYPWRIWVSISHSGEYAAAHIILTLGQEDEDG